MKKSVIIILLIGFSALGFSQSISEMEHDVINRITPQDKNVRVDFQSSGNTIMWKVQGTNIAIHIGSEFQNLGYTEMPKRDENNDDLTYRSCSKSIIVEIDADAFSNTTTVIMQWYPVNMRKNCGYLYLCK